MAKKYPWESGSASYPWEVQTAYTATPIETPTLSLPAEKSGGFFGKAKDFFGYTGEKAVEGVKNYPKDIYSAALIGSRATADPETVLHNINNQVEGVSFDPNSEYFIPDYLRENEQYMQTLAESLMNVGKSMEVRTAKDALDRAEQGRAEQERLDEKYSSLGKGEKLVAGAVGQIPRTMLNSSLGAVVPGANLGTMAVTGMGRGSSKAIADGADLDSALGYGLASGGLSALIASASGMDIPGMPKISGVTSGALSKILPSAQSGLGRTLSGMAGEAGEEMLETFLDPFIQRLSYNPDAPMATVGEVLEAGAGGAIAAGVMGGAGNLVNYARTKGAKTAPDTQSGKVYSDTQNAVEMPLSPPVSVPSQADMFGDAMLADWDMNQQGVRGAPLSPANDAYLANIVNGLLGENAPNEYLDEVFAGLIGNEYTGDALDYAKTIPGFSEDYQNNLLSMYASGGDEILGEAVNAMLNPLTPAQMGGNMNNMGGVASGTNDTRGNPADYRDGLAEQALRRGHQDVALGGRDGRGDSHISQVPKLSDTARAALSKSNVADFGLADTQAELDALPLMDYDAAGRYRDSLIPQARWQAAIDEHGAIPPGRQPRVDIETPRAVDSGEVSYAARTQLEATQDPGDRARLQQDILAGNHNKETISNAELLSRVTLKDKSGAFEVADRLSALVEDGRPLNAQQMAELETALSYFRGSDDPADNAAMNKLGRARTKSGSETGRALQAQNLAKLMTPVGRLGEFIQEVENINKARNLEIEIPSEIKTAYESNNTTSQQADALIEKYSPVIGEQIPGTLMEKVDEIRYLSMLANPRTHIRNLVSNALSNQMRKVKNVVKTGVESVFSDRLDLEKTTSLNKTQDSINFAKTIADSEMQNLMAGGKYNPTTEIMQSRQIFTSKLGQIINGLSKINSDLLEKADGMSIRNIFEDSFARYMTANGWDSETITPAEIARASDYASLEALKATFRDANSFSDTLTKWSKSSQAAHLIIEGLVPFKKTPANIARRGWDYSPGGLLQGLANLVSAKGDKTVALDKMSTGLTGTGIMLAGALAGAFGMAVGKEDENSKKRAFDREGGQRGYSINLPWGGNITLDWAAPSATPFFIGVRLWEETAAKVEAGESLDAASLLMVPFTAVADPMLEMSFMQSLQSALQTFRSGSAGLGDILGSAIESYAGQFFPSAAGAISRTIDPTQYDTSTGGTWERFARQQAAKFSPIVNAIDPDFLTPQIDSRGDERTYGDDILGRAIQNMLNPGLYSESQHSLEEQALGELSETLGDYNLLPRSAPKKITFDKASYTLTAKERENYARVYGESYAKNLAGVYNDPSFLTLDPQSQGEALSRMYDYIEESAKAAFVEGRGGQYPRSAFYRNAENALNAGIPLSTYFVFRSAIANFDADKDYTGKTISGSKKAKVEQYVRSVATTMAEYNALMEAAGY